MKNSVQIWKSVISGLVALAILLPLTGELVTRVHAESSSEIQNQIHSLEQEKNTIQAEIAELEQQKQENLSDIRDAVEQKDRVDSQINLLLQKIDNVNQQISAYNVMIADEQEQLDEALQRLEELRLANRNRIRAMEEEGTLSVWSVLFQANSFFDLLDRLNMIEEIADADRRRMDDLRTAAEQVEKTQQELLNSKQSLEASKEELDEAQIQLQEKRDVSNEILNDLISRGEAYQQLLEEGELAVEDLLVRIAEQEQKYNEAKQTEYAQWLATSTPPESTEPDPTDAPESEKEPEPSDAPTAGTSWKIPCSYVYVSSVFRNDRYHPILGYVRPHNGIDLAAYLGTPVYATRSGTVTTATKDSEAGNYVVINHGDGFSSVYMHLDYYIVSAGKWVDQGDCIGYVGTTGLSEGPHLHFGISYQGTYVNPADYMNF